jgi:hypothetical protein
MNMKKMTGLILLKDNLRLIPYIILGISVFAINSTLELNYFLRGYLVLLESQIGIIVLYLIIARIVKRGKRRQKRAASEA